MSTSFNSLSQVNAATDLNTILSGFTGSQTIYRHALTKLVYTEGIQYLAEKFGCYWLLDKILIEARLNKNLLNEEFQVWVLCRQGHGFVLTCTDGNGRELFAELIPYSDIAAGKVSLWLVDGVLLLPSEY